MHHEDGAIPQVGTRGKLSRAPTSRIIDQTTPQGPSHLPCSALTLVQPRGHVKHVS